jgi:hypothetical protein
MTVWFFVVSPPWFELFAIHTLSLHDIADLEGLPQKCWVSYITGIKNAEQKNARRNCPSSPNMRCHAASGAVFGSRTYNRQPTLPKVLEQSMQNLAWLLVGKPLNILAVSAMFLAAFLVLRRKAPGAVRKPRCLLVPAVAWGAYAVWEFLVATFSPEANIRIDLLALWPVLLIITIWFSFRAFR